ncbi:hypothetical protein OG698_08800 [Streptomyces sp. NBC_01003]|nr:hypothetical protein OG698_08800 [Streptomyces sp. NBC_01003]
MRLVGAPEPSPQFVGSPDEDGEGGDEGDDIERQGGGAEQALQRRRVHEGCGEGGFEGDAGQEQGW